MKKSLLIALVLLVALTGCKNKAMEFADRAEKKLSDRAAKVEAKLRQERKTEPVSVKVLKVGYSDNVAATMLVGSVEPAKSAMVNTKYPGCLKSIKVRKGQKISAGTVIAVIDAQNVASARDAAKAVYDQAKDALNRVEQVYSNGGVSESKLIEVKTAVAKAEAAYRSAEKASNDCRIRAPYSGVVGEIYPHEGMELAALAPLVQLLDVSAMEVHASVPENEYARYNVGMPVRIEVPAAGVTLDGVLSVKGLEASRATRAYDCTFTFEEPKTTGIMPGMLCKVYLTGACQNAIVIPASAVMIDSEGRYVWCCNEGTVIKKHITCDGFSGNGIIVTAGLDEGDSLVIEGSRKISDGMSGIIVTE